MDYSVESYLDEGIAASIRYQVFGWTMVSQNGLYALTAQVREVDALGIPGCLVECGVWRGGASAAMALSHKLQGEPHRDIHLFDSFAGMPPADPVRDGEKAVRQVGTCSAGIRDSKYAMEYIAAYPAGLTHFHEGWFADTVPAAAGELGPIAILRLDGDWYRSTMECLEHLYPLLSVGGWLILDDYDAWPGCRLAANEYMSRLAVRPKRQRWSASAINPADYMPTSFRKVA